jgi:hypothetical protein
MGSRSVSRSFAIAFVASLGLIVLSLGSGCHEVVGADPEPKQVIVEGVVVSGNTFRVESMDSGLDNWEGPGLQARVQLENRAGDRVEADCDQAGRFEVGPVLLSGADEDRLVVTCPGNWSLRMSRLLPRETHLEPDANGVVRVQRMITLPPKGARQACNKPTQQPS